MTVGVGMARSSVWNASFCAIGISKHPPPLLTRKMSKAETRAKARALVLSAAILLAGTVLLVHPASAGSFENVQVFATTPSALAYNFQFAAYNLSGSLIASTQTSYPAAAFELPAGGYLFTVSATSFSDRVGYACPLVEGGATQGAGTTSSSPPTPNATKSTLPTVLPVCYPPSSEYGYATASVSGPQTINIQMQNVTTLPTTPVTVKVSYVNGTAAADASVYASIVGEWYFWWGPNSSVTMGGQTDSSGIVHLVLPAAPAVVTAWKWVPITAGSNGSTVQTTVGGQKVNVTVYWQPTYVGLSGSGLLLPPQNTINITLHYQQPDYWVLPANVDSRSALSAGAASGTIASQPSGVPSLASTSSEAQGSTQYYLPSQIPPVQASEIGSAVTQQATTIDTLTITTAAFVVAALAVVLFAARHRLHRPPSPVG